MDVLDMFTVSEASMNELVPDSLAELGDDAEYDLRFRGFDQSDQKETRLLGYAEYSIASGKWTSQATLFTDAHDDGNSHMPTLAIYQRMLPVYRAIVERRKSARGHGLDPYRFDVNDLREMLDATRRPHANN
jgi:uncharacterized protein YfbU (UPF0304 family)